MLLIDHIKVLQELYGVVIIPQTVADELNAPESPSVVRNWIAKPPNWLQIQPIETLQNVEIEKLDPGEREAILLAEKLKADLVILDDKAARQVALERGLTIIGLLGILKDAAKSGLLDLRTVFDDLREVGFWVAPSLIGQLLKEE
ncbi:DUF3368 domain-containing protein [Brasilonema sp. UFV-L1]|uniref:DUF3368 domain-containing protein n=1 Tax=Brasilonema sp. UFV-L1 TaxID=2234130 RepID=UPI00145D5122|nr:DUF3368 domain-containing protein [Brasilonema sp. UFV-L1]NMG09647.1 DUF3368 domain-containing protein [Brasilonema sp. UFV-L1]